MLKRVNVARGAACNGLSVINGVSLLHFLFFASDLNFALQLCHPGQGLVTDSGIVGQNFGDECNFLQTHAFIHGGKILLLHQGHILAALLFQLYQLIPCAVHCGHAHLSCEVGELLVIVDD